MNSQKFCVFFNEFLVTVKLTGLFKLQGTRDLALKNSMRTYKHEAVKEMRENGELDT